jgi:hypothetical protein
MSVTIKFNGMTVCTYSADEATAAEAELGVKVYGVAHWYEATGEGVTLDNGQMKDAIRTLTDQKNGDGIVRVNCTQGADRSAVAAILYLWSQAKDKTLGEVYDAVEAAYRESRKHLSAMVKKGLVNSIYPLIQPASGGSRPRRLSGLPWDRLSKEKYETNVRAILFGA